MVSNLVVEIAIYNFDIFHTALIHILFESRNHRQQLQETQVYHQRTSAPATLCFSSIFYPFHHGCLWPEYCIYGQFGASFSPYDHLEQPFQVRKLVPTGRPGCVLSRSSLVPSCATHSGSPRLPMARTLHLWPFLALFGHKMGQNGWNKKDMLWISIQVDPNDNLKALVLAKQKLEKR